MKVNFLFAAVIGFLVLSTGGYVYSWQGRMAGMNEPSGLVSDESDFLIHPAKIAKVEKLTFYSNYRFDFRDLPAWNYSLDYINTMTRSLMIRFPYNSSGDEREHEIFSGAVFPWGPGKMGFFLQYKGNRNDYDGSCIIQSSIYIPTDTRLWLENDLDSIVLKLLYGIPMAGFNLGERFSLHIPTRIKRQKQQILCRQITT